MVTRVGEGGLAGAEAARHDEKGGAPRGYAATPAPTERKACQV